MSRPTRQQPQRGDARERLLQAARDVIRRQGFGATSIDDLCAEAAVSKGAFFHHFASKEALGVSAARYWQETTGALFAGAPYHEPADPFDRILAYIDFRRSLLVEDIAASACLVGTMAQEVHATHPAIRDACGASILGHAATLEADFAAAIAQRDLAVDASPASLARHTQTVIQGAFVLAKAGNDIGLARESLDHLEAYLRLLFNRPEKDDAR